MLSLLHFVIVIDSMSCNIKDSWGRSALGKIIHVNDFVIYSGSPFL